MGEPLSESEFAALAFSAGYKSCCELVSGFGMRSSSGISWNRRIS